MLYINLDHHPIILVIPIGAITVEDADRLEAGLRSAFTPKEPVFVVTDARAGKAPGAVVRRRLSEVTNATADMSVEYSTGSVVIVPNRLIAGAIRAVSWFVRDELTPHYCSDAKSAEARIAEAFAENGHAVPQSVPELLEKLDAANGDEHQLRALGLIPAE